MSLKDRDRHDYWLDRRAKRRRLWWPQDSHDGGYAGSKQENDDFISLVDSLKPEDAPSSAKQQSKALEEVNNRPNAIGTQILVSQKGVKRHNPIAAATESSRTTKPLSATDCGDAQGQDNDAWYMGRISAWQKPASTNTNAESSSSHVRETPLRRSPRRVGKGKTRNGSGMREGIHIDASSVSSPSATTSQPLSASSSRALRTRPTLASEQKADRTRKSEREAAAALKKKEEEEERKMTPTEYAKRVGTKFADFLAKTDEAKLSLKGKAIFYVGGDFDKATKNTRTKMDFLRKKGAIVVPTYDPDKVSHIITETSAKATVHACGLKSLDEIPMNIPTVTWEWVNKKLNMDFLCAAFASRIDASPDYFEKKNKLGQKRTRIRPMRPEDDDYSRIEDFSISEHGQEKLLRPARLCAEASSSKPSPSPLKIGDGKPLQKMSDGSVDPLAEFYAKARKDAEEGRNIDSGDESEDERIAIAKFSKFTCDNTPAGNGKCVNQDIVDKLSELLEINKTKQGGDPKEQKWRVFSYSKAIRGIRSHAKRIHTFEDAMQINGVGEKTAQKIKEIIDTGELRRIQMDNTKDVQVIKLFYGIYGVGITTAQKWYANGLRTLDDLRKGKAGVKLTDVQEIGLKHYDDINSRIPRVEVYQIFQMIKKIAHKLDPKLFIEVMGSYRRGKSTCGDIDILLTRSTHDGRTHRGILKILLRELHMSGIITADLAIPDNFNDLAQTYRGLCRMDDKSPHRRIDILCVPFEERGGALLYYTGDDIFNRAIRYKAKQMGYSLSQHGLATRVMRDIRGKKLVSGEIVASETEEEIFRLLGVPWQEPHERVRNL